MVTLLGFFFILFNVALMVIYMPDLVGPVRHRHSTIPNNMLCATAKANVLTGNPCIGTVMAVL